MRPDISVCTWCFLYSFALMFINHFQMLGAWRVLIVFWIIASVITLVALVALYYATLRDQVNANVDANQTASMAHFKAQLKEIEGDILQERLKPEEAEAAKAELARDAMRLKNAASTPDKGGKNPSRHIFALAILGVLVASFGIYATLGNPSLVSQPIAGRTQPPATNIDVGEAVARVEETLKKNPNDVRGWTVLGPIYMRTGRYADAVNAYRQVLALGPISADVETNLAEALMMQNSGVAEGEAMQLLQSAAKRDAAHVRSRFYLAGEATRSNDFEPAVKLWRELLALSAGGEVWVAPAKEGLAIAEAGLSGDVPPVSTAAPSSEMITNMVEGLSERLEADGGTIEEWLRLVRSRLVLGETEKAQAAYDAAKLAFPDAVTRAELDDMALQAGLK